MYRIGITQYEHKLDPGSYFGKAPAQNVKRRALFDNGSDPLQRVRFLLSMAWGSCVDVAQSATGHGYFAGLVRTLDEALLHADWASQDAPGWSIANVTAQLAWNVYYSTATHGGTLNIYDRPWSPDLEDHKVPLTYGYEPATVQDVGKVAVAPEAGDLIVFNSRNIHEVTRCDGDSPRLTVGSFVGLLPDDRLVVWS